MSAKKTQIETAVVHLLAKQAEFRVSDVAQLAGLSKSEEGDRKAIRRVLNTLVQDGRLVTRGAARARVYTHTPGVQQPQGPVVNEDAFRNIVLSPASHALHQYLIQPVHARPPVGYNQDFLNSYEPNRSFYLSKTQRAALHTIGSVETTARPAGTYARNILSRLLIDLAWNSSRLEGNTYSLLETKRLIEYGESADGKDATEAQMILNHKAAIEYIVEAADEPEITSHTVRSIHALLSEHLLGDPGASGRLRQIAVRVSGTPYIPIDNPHLLEECFTLLIEKLNRINDPFEQSFFALVHISYLQAFEDVNKRTSRLIANIPFITHNLRPLSFTDIDAQAYAVSLLGVYEKHDVSLFRDLYLWAYMRSSQRYSAVQQSMGEPNRLKLKYRNTLHEIIRSIILEPVEGRQVVPRIQQLIDAFQLPEEEATQLFNLIETEILSLHDGSIARFRIRPSEFEVWKRLQ